mmetsp:Transcript_4469/g.14138  ORF Transcript_4469/g.14138 Transcript_4469/m.14138 type:complete len:104 (-) Transcript_4469:1222-1533(-)
MPPRSTRSRWLPNSTMRPADMTAMLSALRTVESLCATRTTVHLDCAMRLSTASWTAASDSPSRAEVASSSSSTRGSRKNARAIETRCFCPPESRRPRSPICES